MRLLTPEAARAILARESSESFLALMQITGPGLDPIRVVGLDEGPFDTFARLGLEMVSENPDPE